MISGTDITIGDVVLIAGQNPRDYFKVVTSSDGEYYFQWDHFIDVHHVRGAEFETLTVTMMKRRIVINGKFLDEVALEFSRHHITCISPKAMGKNLSSGYIDNVTVNDSNDSNI